MTTEMQNTNKLLVHKNEGVEALLSPCGGQLLRYQKHAEQPLLWTNPNADYSGQQAIREGIPVCWPWFGQLSRNPETIQSLWQNLDKIPAHGLVRNTVWKTIQASDWWDEPLREPADYFFELSVHHENTSLGIQVAYALTPHLRISVNSCNLGRQPVTFSLALHSYLAISDLDAVEIRGLQGLRYFDSADHWKAQKQGTPFRIQAEVDRVFPKVPERIELIDQGWNRKVVLESLGLPSAVVWNPGADKSGSISQFTPQAYRNMLCIENAALLKNAQNLAPGETHQAHLSIRAESL